MLLLNRSPDYGAPLEADDAALFDARAVDEVEFHLSRREGHAPTPLVALDALARELGLGALHVKDEGHRLGLGSFKALGGAYAVVRLTLEVAARRFGRSFDVTDLGSPELRTAAATLTFACATDGNHGRSVAQGAQLVGAKAAIFVHAGVSDERVAAIARFGASMIRVEGSYDASVAEASRVADKMGWTVVSDTSWPGYERIPGLVMQGYTAMAREALRQLPAPPTHIFIQAGVGGVAAAMAGCFALALGPARPKLIVVEPSRAACIYESARTGAPSAIRQGEPTVMAMLECYEPSRLAWRVLARLADAFMTVEDDDAVAAMNRLARPLMGDPAIVAGESGGAGLAGLTRAAQDAAARAALGLDGASRILVFNTEGATDPGRYLELVGLAPDVVARGEHA